jgi:hypothetical protein
VKATLTFNLPEDAAEFRLAQMGPGLFGLVFGLRERYLKQEIEDPLQPPAAVQALEAVRAYLSEELERLEINFEGIP